MDHRLSWCPGGDVELMAMALNSKLDRRLDGGASLFCFYPRTGPVLEGRRTITLQRHIGEWRIRVEVLSNHERRFPPWIPGFGCEPNICAQRNVARNLRVHELKRVLLIPDIGSAAADPILPSLGEPLRHSRLCTDADVMPLIEQAKIRRIQVNKKRKTHQAGQDDAQR